VKALRILMVCALGVVLGVAGVFAWNSTLNPWESTTVDRTGPSVLKSLTELREYHAASAWATPGDVARRPNPDPPRLGL